MHGTRKYIQTRNLVLDANFTHSSRYTLRSGDGSVMFQFKHNVNGRRTYAEGVVDAVNYLAAKILDNAEQRQYNMIDVLRAGAMRE